MSKKISKKMLKEFQEGQGKAQQAKEGKEKKVVISKKVRLNFALASVSAKVASRTLKNNTKFASDNVVLRAYETCKGIIAELSLTKENAFDTMKTLFAKKPLDVQGKDIRKAQRYLASLCCKASNASRSTSTFQQDITEIAKPQNREYIKTAFPSFDDNVLDVIYKASYLYTSEPVAIADAQEAEQEAEEIDSKEVTA